MKYLLTLPLVLICTTEMAVACGGGGRSGSGFSSRSLDGGVRTVGVPMVSPIAAQTARFNMARQAAIAQTNAYNAAMRPIRLAKANRIRQQKLAQRQARAEIRIAKLEAKRRYQQEFLAKARTWTDSTGKHTVTAILADANDWGVRLKKEDGSFVNVAYDRLSSPDQVWVASVRGDDSKNGVMLARL